MKILAIETSCDETAVAIAENNNEKINLLASSLASSEELHKKTGGIIPEVAARLQVETILPVIDQSLKSSKLEWKDIDAIAVTVGPGLIGSLLVGVETAKTLSYLLNKPIVPVNHLHAHLFVNWLDQKPSLPAIGLVVSGGHTDFVYINNNLEIEYLGGTRDDAAGEAFDKCARIIGLNYPGGPEISRAAKPFLDSLDSLSPSEKTAKLSIFPRPMIDINNMDTSFSGLKTAVLNYTKTNTDFNQAEIAANIQEAIIDTLVSKSLYAIEEKGVSSFILSGGVSANSRLKEKMKFSLQTMNEPKLFYVPQPHFSTDNAAMVAASGILKYKPIGWKDLVANPSLAIDE